MKIVARTQKAVVIGCCVLLFTFCAFASEAIDIQTSHHSQRELQEKSELEQIIKKYDVGKYTFTKKVVIEERAMNHAFPTLTLNVHFLGSDDDRVFAGE